MMHDHRPLLRGLLLLFAISCSQATLGQESPKRLRQERIIQEHTREFVAPLEQLQQALSDAIHTFATEGSEELFELIPGRYPEVVSLPYLLKNLATFPGGQVALEMFIGLISNQTGIKIPEDVVKDILNDSGILLNYFKISPRLLHDIIVGLNRILKSTNQTATVRLPSGFNFPEDLADYPLDVTPYLPRVDPTSPNSSIWFGYLMPEETTVAQAKINLLTSFIFNQLSDNHHLKPTDPNWFVVKVNGQSYSRVDHFLNALLSKDKATLNTYATKRVAVFFGIYLEVEQGRLLEVADPVMIRTGLFDSTGTKEAVLPSVHSEYVIDFQASGCNFSLVWYEGDDGIGFFPGNFYALASWVGILNGPNITGAQGVNAILYMSLFRDILIQAAVKNSLWDNGYGISGVCDDSCSIIELLTTKEGTQFPNLMDKGFVVPEILHRVRQKDEFSHLYYDLLRVVNSMPVDWRGPLDSTARARARSTIVWPPGQEPFQCVVDARAILA